MKKTDLLFRMLEHPDQYSEAQWHDILADDECQELYKLMAETQSAIQPTNVTDEEIDAAWQRLAQVAPPHATVVPLWRKIAATVAIVFAFAGITIAAVQTDFFGLVQSKDQVESDNQATAQDERTNVALDKTTVEQITDTAATAQPQLYDNVELEQILNRLAARYNVTVEYRSEETRSLRLYYEWQPDYTLDKVIEMLNNFESISIHREGSKLIVESSNAQEGKQ